MNRDFVPFSRANVRPDFVRRLPPGWTLADVERADRLDYAVTFFCCAGLAVVVIAALFGVAL